MRKLDRFSSFYFMSAVRLFLTMSLFGSALGSLYFMMNGDLEKKLLGFQMEMESVGIMFALIVLLGWIGASLFFSSIKEVVREYRTLKNYYS